MKVKIVENYDQMSRLAADMFVETITANNACVLGLATGSTPIGTYDYLVKDYKEGKIDFSKVKSINLDEYYPLSPTNDQSYRYFMNYNLFDRVNIDKANTFVPNGEAANPEEFCVEYENRIDAFGGIDLQILGIGRNGHIGFNEPDTELYPFTHVTDLTADTIDANARFFESVDQVPTKAITMGIQSIFKARKVVILASGENKAEAVKAMVEGMISPKCPASLLKLHPDVTVICDKEAAKLLNSNK